MLDAREQIMEFLDSSIRLWHQRRDKPTANDRELNYQLIALYYIDAFHTVRVNLFGSALPKEK